MDAITTYGTGKIVRLGITYTDDNYLWMLELITDNKNICIGIMPKKSFCTKNKELFEDLNEDNIKYFIRVLDSDYEIICYKPYMKNYNPYTFNPRGSCELFDNHKFIGWGVENER